ncbi:MAG: PorT family protein [Bacteroidetes bacterium]|nr:PorT family protein [Bacteroidota bacterium]
MKRLTDEEIDSLFKEAAANYEPTYHSSDWTVMNKKLEGTPFRMPRWAIIAGIGFLVFLSGIGVGVWMNNKQAVATQQSKDQKTNSDSKANNSVSSGGKEVMTSTTSLESKSSIHNSAISSISLPKESMLSASSSPLSKEQVSNSKSVIAASDNRNEKVIIDQPTSATEQIPSNSEAQLLTKQVPVEPSISNQATTPLQEQQSIESQKVLNRVDSTSVDAQEVSKSDSLVKNDPKEASQKVISNGKWFIKVMASPDNSSINFSSSAFAGSNFSTLIEYQLTNRWSFSSGIILSNKKYTTDSEVVYGGKKASGLDGSCRVVDIPIMAYYKISTNSRFSFYSGIGFSSYLMLSENYKYSVVYNSISYPYDTKVEGKNNEWFKLINLSLGINYRLTDRWSLLAEPFAKLPMAGVGEGKVMLSSTGVFLGLKYKIH